MRSILIAALFFSLGVSFSPCGYAIGTDGYLDADDAFRLTSAVDEDASVKLIWKIAKGYSLYKHKFKITSKTPGVEVSAPVFPPAAARADKTYGYVEVYRDELRLDLPLYRSGQDRNRLKLSVTYQGCADAGLCFMPVSKEIMFKLPDANPSGGTPFQLLAGWFKRDNLLAGQDQIAESFSRKSLLFIVLSFLGFGLLLAFTPCVFPMIPIISGVIAGHGAAINSVKAFWLSLSYVLGSAFTYMVFGIIAGLFGNNVQAFFQEPAVIASFSALFIILALSLFGVFTLQMPVAIQTGISNISTRLNGGHWLGAAMMGLLSTLAVGPCVTAPLAGALIYIGKTGDAVLGGLALFALGLGMGIPLLLIGTSAGKILPKSGAWLEYTKAFFGMGLLAVALWLLGRVLPASVALQLWGMLLLIPVFYLGWKKFWKTVAAVLLIYGAFLFIGVFTQKERDYLAVLCNTAVACEAPASLQFHKIKTVQELADTLVKARNENRWVMLDLYADWCVACQEMKQLTFSDVRVKAAVADFILVQADVTKNDDADNGLLSYLNLIGPPSVLFFGPDTMERKHNRVIGFMNSDNFLRRIATLKHDE